MSMQSHLDSELFLEKIKHIYDLLPIKLFFACILSWLAICFDDKYSILISLFVLILIDTFTGFWCAIKLKQVSSRGFYRATVKCLVYFIMLLVARIIDKSVPFPFASLIMDSFLVITEAISILENINKLGFPVPTMLVSKLKAYYEKK